MKAIMSMGNERMENTRVLCMGDLHYLEEVNPWLRAKEFSVLGDAREAAGVRLAIEASNVNLPEKRRRVEEMDAALPPDVPLLVTAHAVSATEIASWLRHPERVLGISLLLPIAERRILEVAPALQTDGAILERAIDELKKGAIETEVVSDEAGLILPRILAMIINEAVFSLSEGIALAEDIDIAMKKGTHYPYGPLEWADLMGLDEVYAILTGLHRTYLEERYRPAPLLRRMVRAGWVGVRSGRGFYLYEKREEEGAVS